MRILVTGGCGFIGSNFIRLLLQQSWRGGRGPSLPAGGQPFLGIEVERVVNLDLLTYAGNPLNLEDVQSDPRYEFVHGDICNYQLVSETMEGIDTVVNFAAETHVDASILSSSEFIRTNVGGTQILLEAARKAHVSRFIQISTDEVYGSAGADTVLTEQTPLAPSDPYAASKASADLLVAAYYRTCGLPAIITRSSDNFGPYQFPEKFIPLTVTNLLADRTVSVCGDGRRVHDWIYVLDHCEALLVILEAAPPGEIYNISANNSITDLELAHLLAKILGKNPNLITHVDGRPKHDFAHRADCTKLTTTLGWRPRCNLENAIRQTIEWYSRNERWWRSVKTGEYLSR